MITQGPAIEQPPEETSRQAQGSETSETTSDVSQQETEETPPAAEANPTSEPATPADATDASASAAGDETADESDPSHATDADASGSGDELQATADEIEAEEMATAENDGDVINGLHSLEEASKLIRQRRREAAELRVQNKKMSERMSEYRTTLAEYQSELSQIRQELSQLKKEREEQNLSSAIAEKMTAAGLTSAKLRQLVAADVKMNLDDKVRQSPEQLDAYLTEQITDLAKEFGVDRGEQAQARQRLINSNRLERTETTNQTPPTNGGIITRGGLAYESYRSQTINRDYTE